MISSLLQDATPHLNNGIVPVLAGALGTRVNMCGGSPAHLKKDRLENFRCKMQNSGLQPGTFTPECITQSAIEGFSELGSIPAGVHIR